MSVRSSISSASRDDLNFPRPTTVSYCKAHSYLPTSWWYTVDDNGAATVMPDLTDAQGKFVFFQVRCSASSLRLQLTAPVTGVQEHERKD